MIFKQLFDQVSFSYTYLLASRYGGEALLIDPVEDKTNHYLRLLDELDLKLIKAIDTHCHADHISALPSLRDKTNCITVMGENSSVDVVSIRVEEGDKIQIEDISLEVLYTPGHTDDSYCFLSDIGIFTGDTLLIRGTGRTDFQNGNAHAAYDSLFNKVLKLNEELTVWPGHDYKGDTSSTIGEEKAHNPRLQVSSAEEYAEIMNNLNLPNPKMMDQAVPANLAFGLNTDDPKLIKKTLSAEQIKELSVRKNILFIDIRESSERSKTGIIPNSIHAPYASLVKFIKPGGMLNQILIETKRELVIYCAYGERSALALRLFEELGFPDVFHLKGGLSAWKKDGREVTTG